MADHSRKSNRRVHGHESEAKRQKLDENYESDNAKEAGAITNICFELLDRIFDSLDIESLLNAGSTCTRLQIAAAEKFTHKFGRNLTVLYPKGTNEGTKGVRLDTLVTLVFGPTILPFLRCFGAHISKLRVEYPDNFLIQYIMNTVQTPWPRLHFQMLIKKCLQKRTS